MTSIPVDRLTTLGNGAVVPLALASSMYGLLQSYLHVQDLEWDVVYHLREICLGRTIEPEPKLTLIQERLLLHDGSVDPVMKAVVLSSVQGEGRLLHFSSPFTDYVDRCMSEFVNAHHHLHSVLSKEEADRFFAPDPVSRALDFGQFKNWIGRTRPPGDEDGRVK